MSDVKPRFISFDGIDGSGKSTQLALFADYLRSTGHDVVCFRDPGTTKLGESVREILLHREDIPLAMTTEMLLYMAARSQLVSEQIRPALAEQKTVLCDRYLLANVIYQGYGGGLYVESLWQVGQVATGGLRPDWTVVFDLSVDTAISRIGAVQDRLEKRGKDYFQCLRTGYLEQLSRASSTYFVADAEQPIELVQQSVRDAWNEIK